MGYCVECNVDDFTHWPSTNRARGFAKDFHPRLCSIECFNFFHTHNIKGLDYARKRQRSRQTIATRSVRRRSRGFDSSTTTSQNEDISPNNLRFSTRSRTND